VFLVTHKLQKIGLIKSRIYGPNFSLLADKAKNKVQST
jgi:hypothetical protein